VRCNLNPSAKSKQTRKRSAAAVYFSTTPHAQSVGMELRFHHVHVLPPSITHKADPNKHRGCTIHSPRSTCCDPNAPLAALHSAKKNKPLAHMSIALHSVVNGDASPSCSAAPAHNAVPRAPSCPCRNEENIAASPIPRVHSDRSRAWPGNVSLKHVGMITAMSRAVLVHRVMSGHVTHPV
jgi:hypothetical protein